MKSASFTIRRVDPNNISWIRGLLVTRPKRVLVDLCLDSEEQFLVEDSFNSAGNLGYDRLMKIIADQSKRKNVQKSLSVIRGLVERYLEKECAR